MTRFDLYSVLIAVFDVLVGCNGLPVGSSDESMVTPADVPTDSPPETLEGQLAPGVFPTRLFADRSESA